MKLRFVHIAIFLLALFPLIGKAQIACFVADDTVGCAPFTVHLTHCGDAARPTFYDWGDGSDLNQDTSHTYATAGFYTIEQYVSDAGSIDTARRESYIRVVTNPVPEFSLHPCAGAQLHVDFVDVGYDHYIVDFGDGSPVDTFDLSDFPVHTYSDTATKTVTVTGYYDEATCQNSASASSYLFQSLQTPDLHYVHQTDQDDVEIYFQGFNHLFYTYDLKEPGASSFTRTEFTINGSDSIITLSDLSAFGDDYCFRLTNYDVCGNELLTPEICALGITATAENNQNQLTWASYVNGDLQEYEIIRNDDDLLNSLSNSYTDSDVICGGTYCYQLKTSISTTSSSGENIYFLSDSTCVESFSTDTPGPLTDFHASVEGTGVRLSWEVPGGATPSSYTFTYGTQSSPNSNTLNTTLTENNLLLTDLNPLRDILCYEVSYSDPCGNPSDPNAAPTVCTFLLTGEQLLDGSFEMEWTDYTGFGSNFDHYIIKWIDEQGNIVQQQNLGNSNNFTDTAPPEDIQQLQYVVCAVSIDGTEVCSNGAFLSQRSVVYIPTAFSPNGDGLNDVFLVFGNFISSIELQIYNQWGELLFVSKDLNTGWDGTYQGTRVPFGVYAFTLLYVDQNGKELTRKGTITLIY